MTRGRVRRYLLVKQGYYPQVVADAGYTVFDWSTLNAGTLFQDSAKTTPASANGDVVGCWTDGVGGVDATQVTTANKPGLATASLNGLPTLSFDGGDLLVTGNISISTFAVWVVVKSTANIDAIFAFNGADISLWTSQVPETLYTRKGANVSSKRASAISDSTFRVIHVSSDGTNANTKIYYNNNDVTSSGASSADIGSGVSTGILSIGALNTGLNNLLGNMGQLLIMSPYPTDTSIITNMESYINNLWNGVY